MSSVQLDAVTNYRASTNYAFDDDTGDTSMMPHGSNFNLGGASLLGFALGRGRPRTACGRSGRATSWTTTL